MKIAIQGHPTRGKEIIRILESLGGKKLYYFKADDKHVAFFIDDKGYISCLHRQNSIIKEYYKIYTLEEFEKEFPFKIGDIVQTIPNGQPGIITELYSDPTYILVYKVRYNSKRELLFPSLMLKLYTSMNTRNITLTLDKAKEWYNKGGELREIALQAFSKKELNLLPTSWEEYCKTQHVMLEKYVFASWCPQKYIALWKLEQLRDCYRQGWKPDWANEYASKHCITLCSNTPWITTRGMANKFLAFQSREVAEEFLENFESLIKEAGDLI